MIVDVVGIDTPIHWGYKPNTTLAITWKRNWSGNWWPRDRGGTNDVYESKVTVTLNDYDMSLMLGILNNSRASINITFGPGELVFGANVIHSPSMPCTIWKYGEVRRKNIYQYEMDFVIRANFPTLDTAYSPSLSPLRLKSDQLIQDSSWEFSYSDTYNGIITYTDKKTDIGHCKARFWQRQTEMARIREFIRSQRGVTFTFPTITGLSHPFSPKEADGYQCKIYSWDDLGPKSYDNWEIEIDFVQVAT